MPALTAVYVDFLSVQCHRAWRWLSLLPEQDVQVRPYLIEPRVGLEATSPPPSPPPSPWDRRTPSVGLELLALGELARESGRAAHHAYVDAAFAAVHVHHHDLALPESWLELATDAHLDLDAFAIEGDRWRAEVGLWQAEATDDLGVDTVPTVVLDDDHGLVLRLRAEVPDEPAARLLLRALIDLANLGVAEVRATPSS